MSDLLKRQSLAEIILNLQLSLRKSSYDEFISDHIRPRRDLISLYGIDAVRRADNYRDDTIPSPTVRCAIGFLEQGLNPFNTSEEKMTGLCENYLHEQQTLRK